jgi:hypothetical protein
LAGAQPEARRAEAKNKESNSHLRLEKTLKMYNNLAMPTVAFDTLEFAKTLKEANFSDEQAEAIVRAMSGIVEEHLATKKDLKELEVTLRRDLKELEYRLTIRMGAMMAAAVAIVAALVKLL